MALLESWIGASLTQETSVGSEFIVRVEHTCWSACMIVRTSKEPSFRVWRVLGKRELIGWKRFTIILFNNESLRVTGVLSIGILWVSSGVTRFCYESDAVIEWVNELWWSTWSWFWVARICLMISVWTNLPYAIVVPAHVGDCMHCFKVLLNMDCTMGW